MRRGQLAYVEAGRPRGASSDERARARDDRAPNRRMPDDHAPSRADEELFEQLLAEAPDFGSTSSESGAVTTILIGLLLLWAAGPLGRLVSGLERPRRPRRADDPGSQD